MAKLYTCSITSVLIQSSHLGEGWANFSIKDQVVKTFSFVGYISPCHLLFACLLYFPLKV